jgi:hypothetical protein
MAEQRRSGYAAIAQYDKRLRQGRTSTAAAQHEGAKNS